MNQYRGTVLAGGVLGLAAGLYAYLRFVSAGTNADPSWALLAPASGVASAVLGVTLWWMLVARSDRWTVRRGVIAGTLTAVLAHPLTWYLLMVVTWARGGRTSLGEPTLTPIEAIPASAVYGAFSLLVAGIETLAIGGLCGALIVVFQRRTSPGVRGI